MLRQVSSVNPDAIPPPGLAAWNAIETTITVGITKKNVSQRKLGSVNPHSCSLSLNLRIT
jgi:hypothetical protein